MGELSLKNNAATISNDNGMILGAPTGGSQGSGTLNASNLFIQSVPVLTCVVTAYTENSPGPTYNLTNAYNQLATNTGAGAEVTLILPAISSGAVYRFAVTAAQFLRVQNLDNTTTIHIGSSVTAAGGFVRSNVVGSMLVVRAVSASQWFCEVVTGTWNNPDT